MRTHWSRRGFLAAAAAATAAPRARGVARRGATAALAVRGGTPVRSTPFPAWPVVGENDRRAWLEVLASKRWNRLGGSAVERFERSWAGRLGAKHALATSSGTSALFVALHALDVGPGDEVIVPPYTFVATVNTVLLHHALPVFADSDVETMQVDPRKIESAITPRTRCIVPVHIGGSVADMDRILEIGKRRGIPVLEDACQAHLAEWRKRKAGTLGAAGCFSFQASKNLNSGEGGAIVTDDDALYASALSFHNQGRGGKDSGLQYARNGDNRRLTEFQGTLLTEQLTRLEEQARTREENAAYLTTLLAEVPGLAPARTYEGCTRNAYHLYMFRYARGEFADLPKETVLRAVRAEGIPCSGGYSPLEKEPFIRATLRSRGFRRIYSERELSELDARNRCPENERLCQEAIWLTQNMLLGPRSDMDQIAEAWRKVQRGAAALVRS
jgi:dTDP-4-amino-4,6-dideoxygalactose transaminase